MKEPRPQDYDPSYKSQVKVETFDLSDLTPIAAKPVSSKNKPKKMSPSPKTTSKKKTSRAKRSTDPAHSSPRPTVRPERPERFQRPERVAAERAPKKSVPTPAPSELAQKREIKRHSFEFYRDQLPHLKRLKAEFMIRGADKSMSAMVREAVDTYIETHSH